MRIGVVVPLYNGRAWIEGTLRSIAGAVLAGEKPIVVVVDDGSTDGGLDGLDVLSVPGLRVVRQPNGGVAAARNTGLKTLPEDVDACLLLDQDDLLTPGALDPLVRLLEETGAVAAAGRASFIDADGAPLAVQPPDLLEVTRQDANGGDRVTVDHLLYRNCIYTPGQVLVRRRALLEVGGFRAEVAPNDDWDAWWRLTRAFGPLAVADAVSTRVRRHGSNVSSNDRVMRTMEIALRGRWHAEVPAQERAAVDRAYRRSERGLAGDWWRWAAEPAPDGGPRPFRHRMRVRSGLFLGWSVLGLRLHVVSRRATRQLADPDIAEWTGGRGQKTARMTDGSPAAMCPARTGWTGYVPLQRPACSSSTSLPVPRPQAQRCTTGGQKCWGRSAACP